jgi:hypothetical protein
MSYLELDAPLIKQANVDIKSNPCVKAQGFFLSVVYTYTILINVNLKFTAL